ncbi:hypothetical protein GCM10009799_21250 [Nocardiopsis rhodophaea]|uniref:Uncharacterized protein n=1 Tax=Nocardiopsis rhodophaea TaxID=280238 RepID=A0ABN2SYK5_9ACTN
MFAAPAAPAPYRREGRPNWDGGGTEMLHRWIRPRPTYVPVLVKAQGPKGTATARASRDVGKGQSRCRLPGSDWKCGPDIRHYAALTSTENARRRGEGP